ncbi:MAG: CBS domain-containing protein [Sulfolobales archaeon]
MLGEKALDLIDIMLPVVSENIESWDAVLRLMRIRRYCMAVGRIISGRSVPVFRIRNLARDLFEKSEIESAVTEISRIDGIFRRTMAESSEDIVYTDPEIEAFSVISIMNDLSLECIPVARDGNVLGVVSEISVIEELKRFIPLDISALDIATKDVETVDSEAPLEEVIGLMIQKGFRRIPVHDSERRIIGLVTMLDIVAEIADQYRVHGELKTLDMLSRPISRMRYLQKPVFIDLETSLREATEVLLRSSVGCVLAGSKESIVGIITERDIIRFLRKEIIRSID